MSGEDAEPPPQPEERPEMVRIRVRKRRRVPGSASRGDRRSRPHEHGGRRTRPSLRAGAAAAAAALLVIILVGAFGGVAGYRSARALQDQVAAQFSSGKADLEAGKTLLSQGTAQRSASDLTAAQAKFTSARAHFLAADQVTRSSRLVRDGQDVPILGAYLSPRATAIEQLSVAGSSLALVAEAASRIDGKLIAPAPGTSAPAQLVGALQASTPDLNQIQSQLAVAQRALKQVQPAVLPSGDRATVTQLRGIVGGGVKGVAELRTLIPVLVQMLGMNGPQTYLVEQVNPAELRAGGGFIGSFSLVQANQGTITLTRSEDSGVTDNEPRLVQGQAGYVTPPGPLQQFVGNKSWVLGDSNFFPSFIENGQEGIALLQHETGIQAQGVISMDPTAVADLLKLTGPLQVPAWNVTIDASNFADYIFQFENSSTHPANRKSFFGDAAGPIISALSSLPASRWPELISVLNQAATQRDLQVYFAAPGTEAEMDRVGWSGSVNPDRASDFLLDVESNFTGTKANHFLQRTYHLDLTTSGDQLVHKVTVDLKDSEPGGYEGSRQYGAYVRVYVPSDATNVSIGDVFPDKFASTEQPTGLQMRDGWVYIAINPELGYGTWTYTFQYDTPYDGSTQRLYWQKQPGTQSDAIDLSWSIGGQTHAATSTLTQDKVVTLTLTGLTVSNGHSAAAELPSLGF